MLQSLTIENFAIIHHVAIDFSQGMTVLSGETGAGKSIIIDALGMLCGGRGSSELIRQGSPKLVVEGLFQFATPHERLEQILADFGIEWQSAHEELILRRELSTQGKNTVRVNGQLANVQLLKQIGYLLVDIHGQNEHQALLNRSEHLHQLDQFAHAKLAQTKADYQVAYQTYYRIRQEWLNSRQSDQEALQRLNFLEFQLQELEQARLVADEDEQLESLSQKMQNAQKISQSVAGIQQLLSDGEYSVLTQLNQAMRLLNEIESYDTHYPVLNEQLATSYYQLEEIAHRMALSEEVELGDYSVDEIEARLDLLGQLKRKYGMDVNQLLAYYQAISEEVYQLRHREEYAGQLEKQLREAYRQTVQLAKQLRQIRKSEGQALVHQIERELSDLYMANARFAVEFAPVLIDEAIQAIIPKAVRLTVDGCDQVEFYATTNVGESMKPLIKVASGGELSRFMLALKRVFSLSMTSQTMVFDEIDTGVSGRIAQAIAEKMAEIALSHQVLCITHLPQVAAIADEQLAIQKTVENDRTQTQVMALSPTERIEAVASMMSGKVLTPVSLQMAQEMIEQLQTKGRI